MSPAAAPRPTAERKRHHFVSVTYLRSWADAGGKLHAYRCDRPTSPLHVRPEEIGFENYYYSQTREDGSRDNDSFENLFGNVETRWPRVLDAVNAGSLGPAVLLALYSMVTMMRTRVPAARDYHEALMALETRTSLKALADMGKLPAKLKRYEDELDTVEVTVNRQRTLGTMGEDMRRFGDMTRRLGFEILRDDTGIGFLTSDNPVAYFDPADAGIRRPYIENTKVEFYFPLSPQYVLHGGNRLLRHGPIPRFGGIADPKKVLAINRITSRFAYRLAFARDRSNDDLIQRHADTSPVLDARVVRRPGKIDYHIGHKFAGRPVLPKFRPEACEDGLYDEDFGL
ncbi:DUF4238 domain-containing protein [Sphingomonas sp. PvP018]|uniref:DUF4238 domain-containing protein n=1 Tax=Sphingomonas sp. PvP018 TaxID=2817852 RepID=UPI001AE47866|nr:DUF4238 domain-containing protein [Sphingomonas sp. PvP018]MBP2511742.1 hypothetical protein [Sphingomonas sp. PvP018]